MARCSRVSCVSAGVGCPAAWSQFRLLSAGPARTRRCPAPRALPPPLPEKTVSPSGSLSAGGLARLGGKEGGELPPAPLSCVVACYLPSAQLPQSPWASSDCQCPPVYLIAPGVSAGALSISPLQQPSLSPTITPLSPRFCLLWDYFAAFSPLLLSACCHRPPVPSGLVVNTTVTCLSSSLTSPAAPSFLTWVLHPAPVKPLCFPPAVGSSYPLPPRHRLCPGPALPTTSLQVISLSPPMPHAFNPQLGLFPEPQTCTPSYLLAVSVCI